MGRKAAGKEGTKRREELERYEDQAPEKALTFRQHDFGLDSRLIKAVSKLGFVYPTLVQSKSIPLALKGKDLLVSACWVGLSWVGLWCAWFSRVLCWALVRVVLGFSVFCCALYVFFMLFLAQYRQCLFFLTSCGNSTFILKRCYNLRCCNSRKI